QYIKYMLYSAFGVAALVTLNGISGWVHGPMLAQDPSLPNRVSSTLGNPIFLASFLILPMFLAGFFALQSESRALRIFFWVFGFVFLIGVVLSVTRGAIVGLIAGVGLGAVAYLLLHPKKI